jgi:hypothetical protein
LNSSFIGHENGVATSKKYDRKSLFLIVLKFNHHLHRFLKAENFLAYIINEDRSLDICEMVVGINEFTKKKLNEKLFIFCRYPMPFGMVLKHETMFPTIGFLHYTETWHIEL